MYPSRPYMSIKNCNTFTFRRFARIHSNIHNFYYPPVALLSSFPNPFFSTPTNQTNLVTVNRIHKYPSNFWVTSVLVWNRPLSFKPHLHYAIFLRLRFQIARKSHSVNEALSISNYSIIPVISILLRISSLVIRSQKEGTQRPCFFSAPCI